MNSICLFLFFLFLWLVPPVVQYDHIFSPIGTGVDHGPNLEPGAQLDPTQTALLLYLTKGLTEAHERQRSMTKLLERRMKTLHVAQKEMVDKTQRDWNKRMDALRDMFPTHDIPLSSSIFGD